MSFNEYRNEFREVIRLAKGRRSAHEESPEISTIETLKNMANVNYKDEETEAELRLEEYLRTLDFETIKVLQTIMYLGRDKDYDKDLGPKEIYLRERSYFDNQGWNTKEIEINQMVEKLPLDEYLESGLHILKIRL